MKKLNYLMIALMAMVSITMTSCLSSNEEGDYNDVFGYAMVRSYMGLNYFEAGDGSKVYPTSESIAKLEASISTTDKSFKLSQYDGHIAYIQGKRLESADPTSTKVTFELRGINIFEADRVGQLTTTTSADGTETVLPANNASVLSFASIGTYPAKFNDSHILIPVAFRYKNDDKGDNYKMHKVSMSYRKGDNENKGNTLVLYMRHDNGGDSKDLNRTAAVMIGFDINEALTDYRYINNSTELPEKIKIMFYQGTEYSTELPTSPTEYIINNFKPAQKN